MSPTLLSLPFELRSLILELILPPADGKCFQNPVPNVNGNAIIATCKQLHEDGLPILYRRHTFYFKDYQYAWRFFAVSDKQRYTYNISAPSPRLPLPLSYAAVVKKSTGTGTRPKPWNIPVEHLSFNFEFPIFDVALEFDCGFQMRCFRETFGAIIAPSTLPALKSIQIRCFLKTIDGWLNLAYILEEILARFGTLERRILVWEYSGSPWAQLLLRFRSKLHQPTLEDREAPFRFPPYASSLSPIYSEATVSGRLCSA